MIRVLTIVSVCFLFFSCKQKENLKEILFIEKGKKVILYKNKERKISTITNRYDNGKLIKIIPNAKELNIKKSLIALRNKTYSLALKTRYYFHSEDSIVDVIIYEWNKAYEAKDYKELELIQANNIKYHDIYVAKFNQISTHLENIFGRPQQGDGQIKEEVLIADMKRWHASYLWTTTSGNYELELSLIPNTSYRVRLKVY